MNWPVQNLILTNSAWGELNFAVKIYKSDRCNQFFTPYNTNTRAFENKLVKENYCRTTRCYNAPHNYLSRLVNDNKTRIERSVKSWNLTCSCSPALKSTKCILWIMGALPSSLFCAKILLVHKFAVLCSLPPVVKNKPLSK